MTDQDPIVVGTDGSTHAASAVSWAADEANRLQRPLRIVTVFEQWIDVRPHSPEMHTEQERQALGILAAAKESALWRHPDLQIETVLRSGDPVEELTQMSIGAHEIVTGSRGRGGFAGMLLGSTSRSLTVEAAAPLIVVPGQIGPTSGEVVVGVDGSEQSTKALEFAAVSAQAREVELNVVQVVHEPQFWGPVDVYGPWLQDVVSVVEQSLEEMLQPITAAYPDLSIKTTVIPGHPAEALRAEAGNAQLLVVGSRGRSQTRSMLLGSISHGVLNHATIPVAVVT